MLYHIKIPLIALIALVFAGCSTTSIPYYSSSDFQSTPNTSQSSQEATMRPYTINGKTYYPTVVEVGDSATGIASWYGPNFHGKKTSNGETYNMNSLTAAHKTLPMNTMVKVTSLKNGKTTIVRINDRGPFVAGRIIDLSKAAATEISMIADGTAPVRLEVIGFYGQIETPANKTAKTHTYTGGNFMVQIGAFRRLEGANTYKAQFDNTNGIYKTAVREYTLNNEPIYRVFLTGFRSEAEARDFISSGQFKGAFIARD
ncbi:septal ring lytic transglycosylase RlpA family protein [Campylobacter lanienae]|uniref:septal ring lytic transglycosylase RlpA family protein n=1 Tax=Campylobacter lanienae TaxID=75658 RepID=UPI001F2FE8E7|nr:septal ring lytic transglycosylase RlpA family protein [Campylobacter lanienae]